MLGTNYCGITIYYPNYSLNFFQLLWRYNSGSLSLPDPSSVTIPSPSALFCLSNALRSRTLKQRQHHDCSAPFTGPQPDMAENLCYIAAFSCEATTCVCTVTCMTAWDQPDSEKSPHPSCLSNKPTFSVKKKGAERITVRKEFCFISNQMSVQMQETLRSGVCLWIQVQNSSIRYPS